MKPLNLPLMPRSPYLTAVRAKLGHDLLTLTAASVSVFDDQGRLLLGLDADSGLWALPGGAIDPDELPSDAAVRECWEEAGIIVQPTALIGVFGGPGFRINYPNGDVTYYTTIAFKARKIGGSLRPDGVEMTMLRYFARTEFDQISVTPSSRVIAEHAFSRSGSPYFAPATWSPSP
jgi:8-oxo-dGTP pyrophosphatase MutT (NUDIX family)